MSGSSGRPGGPMSAGAGAINGRSERTTSASAAMILQVRSMLPLIPILGAVVILSFISDLGGFAHHLIIEVVPQMAVLLSVLMFALVVILLPSRNELLALLTAALSVFAVGAVGLIPGEAIPILFGLAACIVILPPAIVGDDPGVARFWFVVCTSLILTLATTLALLGQQLTVFHVKTLDITAYLIDNALGFNAGARFIRLVWANPTLHQFFKLIYDWLPASLVVCYTLNVRAGSPYAGVLPKAALMAGLIGFSLYHFFPAAGPLYAFGVHFPASLPDPQTLLAAPTVLAIPGAPRNCMPSLHFTWALLAALEARALALVWRSVFVVFALLIALATLTLGEHYLVDLIVAIPFTLCMQAMFDNRQPRLRSRPVALCGAAITLGWFVLLRWWSPAPLSFALLWGFTALTISASIAIGLAQLGTGALWQPLRRLHSR